MAVNKTVLAFIGGFVTGGLIGAVSGYYLATKDLEAEYQKRLEEEMKATREFYEKATEVRKFIQDERPEPEELVEKLVPDRIAPQAARAIKQYQGVFQTGEVKDPVVEETVAVITRNVFHERTVESSEEMERDIRNRTEEAPYVISQEEYQENGLEHEQQTLTYYAGDNVLADQTDAVIEDVDDTIGLNNLAKFGHRSGDRNTVLVRNCALEWDYEIVWSDGKFAVEVLGLDADG